ncbi:MAG: helix-turn-helix transcriptional regulator, partial [Parabacteroides sp.]|nr:helix-turn-helix transcriptional regulator [Parabacteroides sp.]
MKEFAENLKRLRHEKKMSQVELANISCISIKSIQNYEQNRDGRAPTLHNLMLLADIFNVTPYFLYYGGTNEMNSNSLYMDEVLSEIFQLPFDAIKKI